MAKLKIGGVDHEVRPFKLREVRQAAPFIDRVGSRAKTGDTSLAAMSDSALDMLSALAVGIDGISVDDLEAQMGIADLPAVRDAFNAMLVEAGFTTPGEAKPAAAPAAPRARSKTA